MKKSTFKTLLSIILLVFMGGGMNSLGQFNQTGLTQNWIGSGGLGNMFNQNVTRTDMYSNVYVVGSTINSSGNTDIMIQKLNASGDILWEEIINGSANLNDMAVGLFLDDSLNVYFTGTITNTSTDGTDIVAMKYTNNGTHVWTYTYDGPSSDIADDAGIAILGDNAGNIFVAGSSATDTSFYDIVTICLNSNNGSLNWTDRYDYANLGEFPTRMVMGTGSVSVYGGSQSSYIPSEWNVVRLRYNTSTGVLTNINRSGSSIIEGVTSINDVVITPTHLFVAGTYADDTTGSDLALYKLDMNLSLIWESYIDVNDGSDDKIHGFKLDASGNFYIAGHTSEIGQGQNGYLAKLDPSGSVIWERQIVGQANQNDFADQLVLDDDVIYVAASVNDYGNADMKLLAFDTSGNILASARFDGGLNLNDFATDICLDTAKNIIVVGNKQINSTEFRSVTLKYSLFERNYDYVLEDSIPAYLEGNILVRFKPYRMNAETIDRRQFIMGELAEFVDSTTLSELYLKTGNDWSKLRTHKVFKNMTTADSLSITRLGDTIRATPFWSTLSIDIPSYWDLLATCDSLDSLHSAVIYSSPNILYELNSTPIDPLYTSGQLGLYPNSTYPDADIDVEGAWDLEVGQSNVKVGVLDSPIDWSHIEFNESVVQYPSPIRKIGGGFNYYENHELNLDNPVEYYAHGSLVAGIIGAKRNNSHIPSSTYEIGIAGIAGGDMTVSNYGVQLFSLGIIKKTETSPFYTFAPNSVVAEAIHEGYSDSPSNPNDLGLNIMNASWGQGAFNDPILSDQYDECWRNHCVFVASRGNDGLTGNPVKFPACHNKDEALLNVIASGFDGERANTAVNGAIDGSINWASSYGFTGGVGFVTCPNVDFMAPGVTALMTSTHPNDLYQTFAGTSGAAANVTGVASLMYSQHQPTFGYPNKLATEDIEHILEKTAQDKSVTGYDFDSGYGLIDANVAVSQVSDPYYVIHTPNVSHSYSQFYDDNVYINQPNSDIPEGVYFGFGSQISKHVELNLPAGHSIIDYWELKAKIRKGCDNFMPPGSYIPNLGHENNLTVSNFVLTSNSVSFDVSTELWYIIDINDYIPNLDEFWYPVSPSEVGYFLSLHVLKDADLAISNKTENNFILYPNPSNGELNLRSKNNQEIKTLEIYDATGRLIIIKENIDTTNTNFDISNLFNGIYYCSIITSDSETTTIPFIKQ